MEMKINSRFIVAERERRAWSQQHLADAAGLALRTIQRIEARGTGSNESIKAIAACLGVSLMELRVSDAPVQEPAPVMRFRAAKVAGAVVAASLLAGVGGVLWFGAAWANQVLVELGVTIENKAGAETANSKEIQNFRTQFLLDDGQAMELPMEGKFNLVVTPTILDDGNVILSMKLYEQRESRLEFVGEPRVVAPDGKEAEVVFTVGEGAQRMYRIAFKPKVQ